MQRSHLKSGKIDNISSSLSNSSSEYSNRASWKRVISENGSLFYGKYANKTDEWISNPLDDDEQIKSRTAFKLSSKKDDYFKELVLTVSSFDRYRFGRRSSIVESMLGFEVIPFPDNPECLMVANIIDNTIKVEYPYIKEGDWFKSLENIEVRTGNIDNLLLQYVKATKVKLIFMGSCTQNKSDDIIFQEINNFDEFTSAYTNSFQNRSQIQQNSIFLTLAISRDYFKADNTECMFYYPYTPNNFLYKAKGSFLTLDALINNDLRSKAVESKIVVDGTEYYILYGYSKSILIICAFSARYQSRSAAKSNGNDFINYIKLSVSENNSFNKEQLNHVCEILQIRISCSTRNNLITPFLHSSPCLALPKEVQLRISDVLSELESMDYKKWGESEEIPRDLIVCGTALYYKQFLLSSNLSPPLRTKIECFIRLRGIADFVLVQNVKEMYIWEKIEQLDAQNKEIYLALYIRNFQILVVVFNSRHLTNPNIHCHSYLEEIADTVDYLFLCGIESISQLWVNSNKRPLVNLNKGDFQLRHKFRFINQKCISSENIDNNYLKCDSPTFLQSDDGLRKKSETEGAIDWHVLTNKNQSGQCDNSRKFDDPLLEEVKNMIPLNLTTGWSNGIRYFLHLNCVDGVILHPLKTIYTDIQIVAIKEYILQVHAILNNNLNCKTLEDIGFSSNKNVIVKEHSILIDLKNSNSGEVERFFIIGRLFSFPLREVYFCCEQNVSQSIIELSFRMSFMNTG